MPDDLKIEALRNDLKGIDDTLDLLLGKIRGLKRDARLFPPHICPPCAPFWVDPEPQLFLGCSMPVQGKDGPITVVDLERVLGAIREYLRSILTCIEHLDQDEILPSS